MRRKERHSFGSEREWERGFFLFTGERERVRFFAQERERECVREIKERANALVCSIP